jgi:predicted aspartyl protease
VSSRRVVFETWAAIGALTTGLGCAGDFGYQGEPGQPVPASIVAWVPSVAVTVDGDRTGSLLVDTGAPVTILDSEAFGLSPRTYEPDVEVFGLTFAPLRLGAFDVFPDGAPWDGVLGGELLRHFSLTVDYQDQLAWLDEIHQLGAGDGRLAPEQATEIEVRGGGIVGIPGDCGGSCGELEVGATRVLVPVYLEELEPVWFMIDTGASAVVLLPSIVDALGDPSRPRLDGVTINTAGGSVLGAYVRVGALRIGDSRATSVSALVIPDEAFLDGLSAEVGVRVRGLIGGSFLREFRATIDYPGRILALASYLDRSHIDPDEFIGVGFAMASRGTVWELREVYTNTDAFAEGLRPGDTIVELDNESLNGVSRAGVDAILDRFGVGDEVPVGVSRGATIETLLVTMEDLLPAYETP